MNKNLKLSFILLVIASVVIVAWRTLHSFFGGVGLNFVSLLIIVAILLGLIVSDKYVYNRIKDMFYFACGLTFLELIVYFAFEFAIKSTSHFAGFLGFQNFLSVLGILFLCYTMFRFITEYKEVKIGFVEFILGNGKTHKQQKKAKELTNGTLEEKPNAKKEEQVAEATEEIVKTEEISTINSTEIEHTEEE